MAEYTVECKAVGWCGSYSTKELAENRKAQLDFHNPECSPHTIEENPQPKQDGEQMAVRLKIDELFPVEFDYDTAKSVLDKMILIAKRDGRNLFISFQGEKERE